MLGRLCGSLAQYGSVWLSRAQSFGVSRGRRHTYSHLQQLAFVSRREKPTSSDFRGLSEHLRVRTSAPKRRLEAGGWRGLCTVPQSRSRVWPRAAGPPLRKTTPGKPGRKRLEDLLRAVKRSSSALSSWRPYRMGCTFSELLSAV